MYLYFREAADPEAAGYSLGPRSGVQFPSTGRGGRDEGGVEFLQDRGGYP